MTRLEEVHAEIAGHLEEIALNFRQRPRMTLVCRLDWLPDGDIILTDDDLESAIAAIQRRAGTEGLAAAKSVDEVVAIAKEALWFLDPPYCPQGFPWTEAREIGRKLREALAQLPQEGAP